MDPNILKNLRLDSSLNTNDLQLLQQILGSVGQGTNSKMPKITAKERNNLISKLSSNTTLEETPKKELKDMNEQEKKIYREELKKKLKNKQNEKKMMRTSNLVKQNQIKTDTNYSNAIGKISEMMKNINTHDEINNINTNTDTNTNINTNYNTDNKQNLTNVKQETIINNIINKTNENENENKTKVLDNENTIDDLSDYLN
jgi:hypothetical protein